MCEATLTNVSIVDKLKESLILISYTSLGFILLEINDVIPLSAHIKKCSSI